MACPLGWSLLSSLSKWDNHLVLGHFWCSLGISGVSPPQLTLLVTTCNELG